MGLQKKIKELGELIEGYTEEQLDLIIEFSAEILKQKKHSNKEITENEMIEILERVTDRDIFKHYKSKIDNYKKQYTSPSSKEVLA